MKQIVKNFASNASYQLFIIIFPLLTMPYVARVLGAEQLGVYNYTYSIAIYFALFVKLGADHYGNRSIAKVGKDLEKRSQLFWEIFSVQLINGLICILAYLITVGFFVQTNKTVAYIQVFLIVSYMLDINWFFYGMERFNIVLIRNVLVKISTLIFIFLLVKKPEDIGMYTLILNLGTVVGFLVTWLQLRHYIQFKKVSIKNVLSHLKPTGVLFIPIVSATIYTSFTSILLGSMSNMSNVGYYNAGSQILSMPKGIIAALGTVMLPKMAASYSDKNLKKSAEKYLDLSLLFVTFLSVAFAFGILGIGKDFIPLFYGEGFEPSVSVLMILCLYLPFYSWGNVIRTQSLIPQGNDRPFVISVLLGAIVSIIVNLLLIKPFGVIGAAIGTFASEVVLASYQIIAARHEINFKKFIQPLFFAIFSGGMMFGIIQLIPSHFSILVRLSLKVALGGLAYLLMIYLYILYSKAPVVNVLKQTLKRDKQKVN
ncbi:flippase [Vagococcus sp. BWB3-3]|uniref:Flippase n=1 Tax=Vagococcus allomyrinae TaxID=2794353 RepID=A0A940SX37_9ENTE|nr:flippase [Vagococcus allomyrinae]